ncbi:alpha-amylase family glycosyl hydrolase [Virgibacillus siamensis]|uniref:alpha-amylase family glycosyl hydrolase n=1 Tax=Virgibacillus siamensis TaxID=480071 RepID=UPI000985C9D8|nr:alpha-amylase family glycosyl hydrolase [Virgibacillus siamensis]
MKQLAFILLIGFVSFGMANPVDAAKQEGIKGEIIYNILVDRFQNGDQSNGEQINLKDPHAYHGGDFEGVISKLDKLKELGFTTIVLSPVMENAPDGFHGYWITDFYKVEKQFGTMQDLQKLVKEAHEHDMKVVMELVTNYVSPESNLANDPAKKDWFTENNLQDTRWLDDVNVLDQSNPEVQDYIADVADYWIEKTGIDGYRFHAADQMNQNYLKKLTQQIHKEYPDFYLLADILQPKTYTGHLIKNTSIQAVENNALQQAMVKTFAEEGNPVQSIYDVWEKSGKRKGLSFLDNKRTERFSQKFYENGRNALTTWKLALTYLYTAPGTPMIFQGSEIPMGGDFPESLELVKFNSAKQDLQKHYNRVSALRTKFPALQKGSYELLGTSGAMSLFKRTYKDQSVYVAINNDVTSQAISITDVPSGKMLKGLIGDNLVRESDNGKFKIGLARETAEVYIVQEDTGFNWLFIGMIVGIFVVFIGAVILLSRKQKKREAGLE